MTLKSPRWVKPTWRGAEDLAEVVLWPVLCFAPLFILKAFESAGGLSAIAAAALLVAWTLGFWGLLFLRWHVRRRPQVRARRGQCPRCGYDLTGNESEVCPECGTTVRTCRGCACMVQGNESGICPECGAEVTGRI